MAQELVSMSTKQLRRDVEASRRLYGSEQAVVGTFMENSRRANS